jgi:hypothetical protein
LFGCYRSVDSIKVVNSFIPFAFLDAYYRNIVANNVLMFVSDWLPIGCSGKYFLASIYII